MNPLPRLLATGLFVVLAALTALLAAPAWRVWRTAAAPDAAVRTPATVPAPAAAPSSRLAQLPARFALALAFTGALLAAALVVSLAAQPGRRPDTVVPFNSSRTEIGALTKLAENSAAQEAELTRERDVRRRAVEDADLKQRLLTQALEEKIRLGRDLHDGIIQSLYAVGLTLESARELLQTDPAAADSRLEQCRAVLNASIRDARAYITGLAAENLRRTGFARGLESLLAELRSGRTANFDIKVDDDAIALLSPEQTIEALQIAREAVSNALRHGHASVVTVRVQKGEREVCLLVQDNGTGFDAAHRRDGGHGLGNMEARAGQIGATLGVTSRPGEGVRVLANIPILQPALS
jgi:signal transduction histidine kinase